VRLVHCRQLRPHPESPSPTGLRETDEESGF